jgi:hypothetical protein
MTLPQESQTASGIKQEKTRRKPVARQLKYEDLTIDEAIELLQEVKQKQQNLFADIGHEVHDFRKSPWMLQIVMLETEPPVN